ncbi:PREDICTED: hexokinase-3-like isoform X1 [Brassica oleracea var. oleracea]|uniref:hexokinase-3-like isoform X1 n=1 Tax=Brassica oleracea var. oleracea TaxID=109376 RepID=UPI0006A74451|nr:PREDICTED: hexokinase-3-like isoform X1 [Brassica oleracea var. oleracea]XP_013615019.1 PREDICTED: hexokinase-3-like isoform X1 [Brassica oleracea var. oleracea]
MFPQKERITLLLRRLWRWLNKRVHLLVGKDIAECLQEALNRTGLHMHVAALVNDTVGALSLGYYHDPDTVVFGTGSDSCYLERTDAIIKSQGLLTPSRSMSIWSGEIFGPHTCQGLHMTLTWMQRVQIEMIWDLRR